LASEQKIGLVQVPVRAMARPLAAAAGHKNEANKDMALVQYG
jgi:hypothetical protein